MCSAPLHSPGLTAASPQQVHRKGKDDRASAQGLGEVDGNGRTADGWAVWAALLVLNEDIVLPQKMKDLSEVTLQMSELAFKAVLPQVFLWLCVDSAGPPWGRTRGKLPLPLPFPCLPHPASLMPPALFSQLPDFIVGDLFLALTIDPSEGLLTISETLREDPASFTSPARSQLRQSLGLRAWE